MRLRDRVAIVTGSAGPTGSVIATRLSEEGAAVVLNVHRAPERAHELHAKLTNSGARALVVEGDMTRRADAEDLVSRAAAEFGRVDILVNNASGMQGGAITELSEDALEFALASNLKAAFYCSQAAARIMVEQRYGRIVNLSSLAASGSIGNANYAVAKAGVEGLTRTLALELGREGITANCVSPGLIASPKLDDMPETLLHNMTRHSSIGVLVEPIDIANAVLFFASDEARYVTGQILHVSAGLDVVVAGMQES